MVQAVLEAYEHAYGTATQGEIRAEGGSRGGGIRPERVRVVAHPLGLVGAEPGGAMCEAYRGLLVETPTPMPAKTAPREIRDAKVVVVARGIMARRGGDWK